MSFKTFQDVKNKISYFTDFWPVLSIFFSMQGCALRKIEGCSELWNCEIQGAQNMLFMEKLKFLSCPWAKVRPQGPPVAARPQPCYAILLYGQMSILTSVGFKILHRSQDKKACVQELGGGIATHSSLSQSV